MFKQRCAQCHTVEAVRTCSHQRMLAADQEPCHFRALPLYCIRRDRNALGGWIERSSFADSVQRHLVCIDTHEFAGPTL